MHIHPSSPNSAASLQSEESAAIKIQAGFRGYRVRKQLHHQQSPNGYQHHHRRRNTSSLRRQQRQQRIMENQHSAASTAVITPNGALRDERSSGSEGASMEDRCATKIQAGVRGFLVRKKQKIAADAATKIQAGFRGFKVRKEAQKLKQV